MANVKRDNAEYCEWGILRCSGYRSRGKVLCLGLPFGTHEYDLIKRNGRLWWDCRDKKRSLEKVQEVVEYLFGD